MTASPQKTKGRIILNQVTKYNMELMKTSDNGIKLIKEFEGCKLYAYRDSVGIPTVGYGHTKNVKMGMSITQAQAEQFLREDIEPIERVLNAMNINFKQQQFDALVSWAFNLGTGALKSSTMYKYIIARRPDLDITDQLVKWHNAGGKPLLGLMRRRCAEANLFIGKPIYRIENEKIKR